jgi:hypothetical protein
VTNRDYVAGYLAAKGAEADSLYARCARREVDLSRLGLGRGERPAAVICLARAANYASETTRREGAAELVAECQRHRESLGGWDEIDFQLFWASLNLGALDQARRHLETLGHWRQAPVACCSWALMTAAWAKATGDREAAEETLAAAVEMSRGVAYGEVPLLAAALRRRWEHKTRQPRP